MKTMKIKRLLGLITIALLVSMNGLQAQDKDCPNPKSYKHNMHQKHCDKQGPHAGGNFMEMIMHLPDITEAQTKELKALNTKHIKNMMSFKNQLAEKKARLNTLSTADKADMNAINAVVDEIGTLKTKMMKEKVAFQQSVRKVLTEDQRLIFDMRHCHKKGHRPGHGPCRK